jgi:hypothetical protein
MAIRIPIFLSAPTTLNPAQQAIYDAILRCLEDERLQPRALGRSDFPQSDPLTEVYYVARACYGGIILGFAQLDFESGVLKRGSPAQKRLGPIVMPSPWNQIEAGMLVALRRPILVFVEEGITGGIFDQGAHSTCRNSAPRGSTITTASRCASGLGSGRLSCGQPFAASRVLPACP